MILTLWLFFISISLCTTIFIMSSDFLLHSISIIKNLVILALKWIQVIKSLWLSSRSRVKMREMRNSLQVLHYMHEKDLHIWVITEQFSILLDILNRPAVWLSSRHSLLTLPPFHWPSDTIHSLCTHHIFWDTHCDWCRHHLRHPLYISKLNWSLCPLFECCSPL